MSNYDLSLKSLDSNPTVTLRNSSTTIKASICSKRRMTAFAFSLARPDKSSKTLNKPPFERLTSRVRSNFPFLGYLDGLLVAISV